MGDAHLVARITAYWALTERYVRDSFSGGGDPRICRVSYEALCRDPESAIAYWGMAMT